MKSMSTAPLKPTPQNVNRVLRDAGIASSNTRAGLRATAGFEPGTVNLDYDVPVRSVRLSDSQVAALFEQATTALAARGLTVTPSAYFSRKSTVAAA